jgi:hypothetical protein
VEERCTKACASMNRGSGVVVLGMPVIEALRTTSSGGNGHGVKSQVLGARFICRGGGR